MTRKDRNFWDQILLVVTIFISNVYQGGDLPTIPDTLDFFKCLKVLVVI